MRKKILAALCALAVVMSTAAVLPQEVRLAGGGITAAAVTEGDYQYKLREDGTAEITYYTGSDAEVTVPEKLGGRAVTVVGDYAFFRNGTVVSVKLPDTVKEIGRSAFSCSVETVDIPESIETIGERAFAYCAKLSAVTLPDGLKAIGNAAFLYSGLTEAVIPDSVESIGSSAFEGCQDLSSLKLPQGLTEIQPWTFEGTALTSVEIPESVTSIGGFAFGYCNELADVKLPNGLTRLGEMAFTNTPWLESKMKTGKPVIENGVLISAEEVTGKYTVPKTVRCIGGQAFAQGYYSEERELLTQVVLPDGLIGIGDGAFYNCTGLKSINVPDSVEYIGVSAFSECTSLTDVTIPENFGEIGAFEYTPWFQKQFGDQSILIEGGTLISGKGFKGEVVIPDSVKRISRGAFSGNTEITSVTLPKGITEIESNTFDGCTALTEVIIPEGVTAIYDYAFNECTSLKKLDLPESLEYIGYAFMNSGLTELTIPDKVKNASLSGLSFTACGSLTGCSSLRSLTLGGGLGVINSMYPELSVLEELEIGEGCIEIGVNAFTHSFKLKSVKLPNTLRAVYGQAFMNCPELKSVTIPKNVSTIEERAFGYAIGEENIEKLSDFTIYCYEDTAGHRYALDNGFDFVLLSDTLPGDCNGDGKVTMKDYSELQKHLSGWDVEINLEAADLNGDGKVTMKDYAALQRKLNGWS